MGIAFQSLKHEDVENIGYVIPTPVIMHFITDYEKSGEYTGTFSILFWYMKFDYISAQCWRWSEDINPCWKLQNKWL